MLDRIQDCKMISSTWARVTGLAVLALCVFFLPYKIPVPPSISLSYLVQYNNHAALVIFTIGAFVYALLTGGDLGNVDNEDRKLTYHSLVGAVLLVLFALIGQTVLGVRVPYGESGYNINRIQMLTVGLRPYQSFEYAYGPLNLYIPKIFGELRHGSMVAGYFFWWITEYIAGTAMLWFTVRHLPFALRWRPVIFWVIAWLQLLNMPAEGIQYTPVRLLGTAFAVTVVVYVQNRWRNAYASVVAALLVTAFELGISPEQGIGVAAGLLCWFAMLTWQRAGTFSMGPLALNVAGTTLMFGGFARSGLFISMKTFSSGAYSLPILPSLHIGLILIAYVAAACAAVKALRDRQLTSAVLPLAFTGFGTMPAAFGRADEGHLQIAFAALLLGIAYLQIHSGPRRVWSMLVFLSYILPASFGILGTLERNTSLLRHDASWFIGFWRPGIRNIHVSDTASLKAAQPTAQKLAASSVIGEAPIDKEPASASWQPVMQQPCPVVYLAPTLWLGRTETTSSRCIDNGYYIGVTNVFTVETIQRKIDELAAHPRRLLLMVDQPLEQQFPVMETNVSMLAFTQGYSPFIPTIKRQPMTFQPIIDFIRENYRPDPEPYAGLRIWRPKS